MDTMPKSQQVIDADLPEPIESSLVSQLAVDLFGLSPPLSLLPLPGEYDVNFIASSAASGKRFVVKILHSSRSRNTIDLQVAALRHVERTMPDLSVPRIVRSLHGRDVEPVPTGGLSESPPRFIWVLKYIEGRSYADARPHTAPLLRSLGVALGNLSTAMVGFAHDGAARKDFKWDLRNAEWIAPHVDVICDARRRSIVERVMRTYEVHVKPIMSSLRCGVVHGDANDYNVLTSAARGATPQVTAILDFGDMHDGWVVADLAVGAAYGVLGHADPLAAAAQIVAGYTSRFILTEAELDAVYPLLCVRLAVSVVNSSLRAALSDDPYVTVSQAPAWAALEALIDAPLGYARALLRTACGYHRAGGGGVEIVGSAVSTARSVLGVVSSFQNLPPDAEQTWWEGEVDGGFAADEFPWGNVPQCFDDDVEASSSETVNITRVYIARFGAVRRPLPPHVPAAEPPSRLLGVAIAVPSSVEVRIPRDSRVASVSSGRRAVLLQHGKSTPPFTFAFSDRDGVAEVISTDAPVATYTGGIDNNFFSIWRGVNLDPGIKAGATLLAGSPLGVINGVAFVQAVVNHWDLNLSFPVWSRPSTWDAYMTVVADPTDACCLPLPPRGRGPPPSLEASRAARASLFSPNVRLSYSPEPLKIVRGKGSYVFDAAGTPYLDAYNNVPSVGHCHPRVVAAAAAAACRIQTNTRYLHDETLSYARELTALFPPPLSVVILVASGSEANDLALRLAQAATGRADVICLDHAYHGHTAGALSVSPYKFNGPAGGGCPPRTHVAPCPDLIRSPYPREDADNGIRYATDGPVALLRAGVTPAAFIAESFPSVAGQVVLPTGYLAATYEAVRAAGGLCIADEVQTGFGRLGPGKAFWGFAMHDVVPDIVTLGKPIANGYPMGAVVTTPAIAAALGPGMEVFATGGGGPVAAAAARGVLAVLRDERLPEASARVGAYALTKLRTLMERHPIIADVRGQGLFIGIELAWRSLRGELIAATDEASYVVLRLRQRGILIGTEGPAHNVLKVRPPLVWVEHHVDLLVEALASVLHEDGMSLPPLYSL